MSSAATITIAGHLGQDATTRFTPDGVKNVQFTVAVNPRPNQRTNDPNWYRVTVWGAQADAMEQLATKGHLGKGRLVFVTGAFEVRGYTAGDGSKRTSLDINAAQVQLLGPSPVNGQSRNQAVRQSLTTPAGEEVAYTDPDNVPY